MRLLSCGRCSTLLLFLTNRHRDPQDPARARSRLSHCAQPAFTGILTSVSILFQRSILAVVVFSTTSLLSAPGPAPTSSDNQPAGCSLHVHVDGLRNSKGVVGSVLFTSPQGWPENPTKAFRRGPTPIPAGQRQATVVWENLPPGDYALAAIHDENSNARLDRNFIGIPKEGFGFANNPHVGLSAPAFQAAVIHVACPVTETAIHIQYR